MPEKIRVLYVDDERSLLEIGKKFLEKSGDFTVFTAESASEALALVKEQHIDAIISDYQMSAMNGIDLLKAVRNTNPDLPFIFFSGKGTKEIVIEAFRHGADLYLQKRGDPKFL
ncbi:MAG: response regulator, partial [Methanoregula sp.]|nr:response regulator [Methanoregula sp.]